MSTVKFKNSEQKTKVSISMNLGKENISKEEEL